MIDNLAGVIVWTEAGRFAGLVAFYRDVLRLPVHSARPHFVAFELAGVRLSVGIHSEVTGETREPVRVTINLGTAHIHDAVRDLTARGVAFVRPPEREHWGGWVASLRDPDGNLVQLLQQPAS